MITQNYPWILTGSTRNDITASMFQKHGPRAEEFAPAFTDNAAKPPYAIRFTIEGIASGKRGVMRLILRDMARKTRYLGEYVPDTATLTIHREVRKDESDKTLFRVRP